MSELYDRQFELIVEGNNSAFVLNDFRCKFVVRQWTLQSPNAAEIRIYNLSKDTAARIREEGKKVTLTAGYKSNSGRIYSGQIVYKRTGRENPVDTFLDLYCRDGDQAYNKAVINHTFPAGSTQRQHVDKLLEAMQQFGVQEGTIKGLSDQKYPRPVVMFGMARHFMRIIAQSNGASWSIRNDQLDHIPDTDDGAGGTIKLNANTGLIGMPEETLSGIIARALINPNFRVNGQIEIDEKSINRAPWSANYSADPQQQTQLPALGTSDGVYRVLAIDWEGDTRGTPWYAVITCVGAKNGSTPSGQLSQGRS